MNNVCHFLHYFVVSDFECRLNRRLLRYFHPHNIASSCTKRRLLERVEAATLSKGSQFELMCSFPPQIQSPNSKAASNLKLPYFRPFQPDTQILSALREPVKNVLADFAR